MQGGGQTVNTIPISATVSYDVCIGRGILPDLGVQLRRLMAPCTAAVLSDETVFPLYGKVLCASLRRAGFTPVTFVLPAGERCKTLEVYGGVLNFLTRHHLRRSDVLIALGGGAVGDLTGFAAATYLRGLRYVQVPTTLLAAVDASVGGKTALNLPAGKNLVGAFWQPSLVWCDVDTLATLPEDMLHDGCAEVIKCALLGDADLFRRLKSMPVSQDSESVIGRCVTIKRDLVAQDERDRGVRRLLNLGHTVGHAVEACSGYRLAHGRCVAIGLAVITRAAAALGYCPAALCDEVTGLLQSYGLPVSCPYRAEELLRAAENDKKIHGKTLTLAVPVAVGQCRLVDIPASKLGEWLIAGGFR